MAIGISTVPLISKASGTTYEIVLSNVLLIPEFRISLISVHKPACLCWSLYYLSGWFRHVLCSEGPEHHTCCYSQAWTKSCESHSGQPKGSCTCPVDINLLHRRMGHIFTNHIQHMVKSGRLQGIDTLVGTPIFCEACVLGKMKQLPFESQEQPRTTRPLEMVHMDVGGPITPRSREGYRFWIVIVDDFTHFSWVYFMKHKNEALQIYNQWKKDVQTVFQSEVGREDHSESYVKWVRSDGGTEYINKAFRDQLKTDGTLHETSAPYTPEQNGLAERMNQTLSTLANIMLEESKLPKSSWANAMATAAYVTA